MYTASVNKWGLTLSGTFHAAVDCGKPYPLPNSAVTYNRTVFGSTASYSCMEGYVLTDGSSVRLCQVDGEWSSGTPRCEGEFMKIIISLIDYHNLILIVN